MCVCLSVCVFVCSQLENKFEWFFLVGKCFWREFFLWENLFCVVMPPRLCNPSDCSCHYILRLFSGQYLVKMTEYVYTAPKCDVRCRDITIGQSVCLSVWGTNLNVCYSAHCIVIGPVHLYDCVPVCVDKSRRVQQICTKIDRVC